MDKYRLYALGRDGPWRIPLQDKAASIHDVLKGWPVGVYTVLRTYSHNKFLSLDEHLVRLERSISRSGWNSGLDHSAIRTALNQVCTEYPLADAMVRIDFLARHDWRLDEETRLLIAVAPFSPLPQHIYENGVVVGTSARLFRQDPAVKSAEFVNQRRDFLTKYPDLFEVLLVDQDGYVREGASSNFYGVCGGVIVTAQDGILPGTARQIVLQVASVLDIEVKLESVHLDQIPELEEAAISSSSRGVVPVIQIDDRSVGVGKPGAVVKQLMRGYQDHVERSIKPAIEVDQSP